MYESDIDILDRICMTHTWNHVGNNELLNNVCAFDTNWHPYIINIL